MEYQGYDISAAQALIPKLQRLLLAFRNSQFPVFYTRQGKWQEHTTPLLPS
jgi:nicotinamidase-related amidase